MIFIILGIIFTATVSDAASNSSSLKVNYKAKFIHVNDSVVSRLSKEISDIKLSSALNYLWSSDYLLSKVDISKQRNIRFLLLYLHDGKGVLDVILSHPYIGEIAFSVLVIAAIGILKMGSMLFRISKDCMKGICSGVNERSIINIFVGGVLITLSVIIIVLMIATASITNSIAKTHNLTTVIEGIGSNQSNKTQGGIKQTVNTVSFLLDYIEWKSQKHYKATTTNRKRFLYEANMQIKKFLHANKKKTFQLIYENSPIGSGHYNESCLKDAALRYERYYEIVYDIWPNIDYFADLMNLTARLPFQNMKYNKKLFRVKNRKGEYTDPIEPDYDTVNFMKVVDVHWTCTCYGRTFNKPCHDFYTLSTFYLEFWRAKIVHDVKKDCEEGEKCDPMNRWLFYEYWGCRLPFQKYDQLRKLYKNKLGVKVKIKGGQLPYFTFTKGGEEIGYYNAFQEFPYSTSGNASMRFDFTFFQKTMDKFLDKKLQMKYFDYKDTIKNMKTKGHKGYTKEFGPKTIINQKLYEEISKQILEFFTKAFDKYNSTSSRPSLSRITNRVKKSFDDAARIAYTSKIVSICVAVFAVLQIIGAFFVIFSHRLSKPFIYVGLIVHYVTLPITLFLSTDLMCRGGFVHIYLCRNFKSSFIATIHTYKDDINEYESGKLNAQSKLMDDYLNYLTILENCKAPSDSIIRTMNPNYAELAKIRTLSLKYAEEMLKNLDTDFVDFTKILTGIVSIQVPKHKIYQDPDRKNQMFPNDASMGADQLKMIRQFQKSSPCSNLLFNRLAWNSLIGLMETTHRHFFYRRKYLPLTFDYNFVGSLPKDITLPDHHFLTEAVNTYEERSKNKGSFRDTYMYRPTGITTFIDNYYRNLFMNRVWFEYYKNLRLMQEIDYNFYLRDSIRNYVLTNYLNPSLINCTQQLHEVLEAHSLFYSSIFTRRRFAAIFADEVENYTKRTSVKLISQFSKCGYIQQFSKLLLHVGCEKMIPLYNALWEIGYLVALVQMMFICCLESRKSWFNDEHGQTRTMKEVSRRGLDSVIGGYFGTPSPEENKPILT